MNDSMEDVVPYTNHTIYPNCTSRTRGKQQFSFGGVTCIPEEDDIEGLEELLRVTWTIFGVSILFNFHTDEIHLKQYAKRLREEIAGSSTQENVTYTTEFSVMENVTLRPSPTDPPPIQIKVHVKNNASEEGTEKCTYNGILLSWRTNTSELTAVNSIRLPLLLCRGTQNTMRTVHNVLHRMFDCIIIPLPAQEDDLIWLVPILITPTSKEEYPKNTDEIRMVYKIPGLPDTDTITIKFRILDLIKILKVIIKDQNDEASAEISFNLEHIEQFRDVLHTQVLETAGLQLGLCTLFKIILPALTIMGNKMKVMNADAINRILLYLNEKALDIFYT